MAKRKVVCKTMKKILSLVIAAMLLVSCLAGCGKEDKGGVDTSSIPVSQGESTSDTAASDKTESDKTSSEDKTSSGESASDKISSLVNSMPTTSNKDETPVCKHTKTKAVSVSTGKYIIDASKLDVVVHNVVCADCSKVIKTENHVVDNNKCTLCSQSNFKMNTVNCVTANPTLDGDARLNDDGSVNYDVMLDTIWFDVMVGEYFTDEHHAKIPESVVYETLKKKFVITDTQFAALKAQGSYDFLLGGHTYDNGYFYFVDPAAGGPGLYSHTIVGYGDDKSGNFTLYINYTDGGADVEESERKHLYYYAVEYSYSGYSNLSVITGEYSVKKILGFAPVVDSMRVKAIKKLSTLPSDMIKVK